MKESGALPHMRALPPAFLDCLTGWQVGVSVRSLLGFWDRYRVGLSWAFYSLV
uniref:Uncharacterized protein n=1 Tax=Thermosporothrix sp. COM3 TaxID=2490863 RepID=A0A455SIG3_9CHLR|nr:hypothetical protein KTC_19090 [Thermosporothrix sp. COM3]